MKWEEFRVLIKRWLMEGELYEGEYKDELYCFKFKEEREGNLEDLGVGEIKGLVMELLKGKGDIVECIIEDTEIDKHDLGVVIDYDINYVGNHMPVDRSVVMVSLTFYEKGEE